MPIQTKQKAWAHQLKAVAFVEESEYRSALKRLTGAESLADDTLGQDDFDAIMRWLEVEICKAIAEGLISVDEVIKKVGDPWRFHQQALGKRSEQGANAYGSSRPSNTATSKQLWKIDAMRKNLVVFEPEVKDFDYCKALINAAALGPAPDDIKQLSTAQASALINALIDRLDYAKKRADRRTEAANMPTRDPAPPINLLSCAETTYKVRSPLSIPSIAENDDVPF